MRDRLSSWIKSHDTLAAVGLYAAQSGLSLAATTITGILVARHLGPESFGALSIPISIFVIAQAVVPLGLPGHLISELPRRRETGLISASVRLQVSAGVIGGLLALAAYGLVVGWSPDTLTLGLALLPFPVAASMGSLGAALRTLGRVKAVASAGLIGSVVLVAVRLAGIGIDGPLWLFAFAMTGGSLARLAVIGFAYRGARSDFMPTRRSRGDSKELLRKGAPLLLAAASAAVLSRADILMLGVFASNVETGVYSAALRLFSIWQFLPAAALAAVGPRLAREHALPRRGDYDRLAQRWVSGALMVGLLAGALTALVAPWLVPATLGEQYESATPILLVLLISLPLRFLTVASARVLIDFGLSAQVTRRSLSALLVNIALNVWLIPELGAMGAAVSLLAAHAVEGLGADLVWQDGRRTAAMQLRALTFRRWPTS